MLPTEAVIVLVLLDMCANIISLVLVAKKFDIFENIYLLHWKRSAIIQLFAIFGFTVWFLFKTVGFALPAFEERFEPLFIGVVVSLFFIGHILLTSVLLKGAPKR